MDRGAAHSPALRAGRLLALLSRPRVGHLASDRAIVSFTFDDIPDNAASTGAPILDAYGAKGTFYVAAGLCGREYGPWRFIEEDALPHLVDAGHEIGCHTFAHPDVQRLGPDDLAREFDMNAARLAAIDPRIQLESFAYPYGGVGRVQKALVAKRFRSGRGTRAGLNAGRIDLAQLRAVSLYDHVLTRADLNAWIASAVRRKAWLIFYTHDVADPPSNQGTSRALLAAAVEESLAAGCAVLTVRDALRLAERG